VATGLGTAVLIVSLGTGTSSAGPGPGNGGGGLSTVPVPQPIGGDIVNQAAAVRLGKALFWDEQVGGDGQIACATCHFHAGADNRAVTPTSTGVVGSQGIAEATFVAIGHPADSCGPRAGARSVTGRNAPSVINAVFNRDNFWDGRANHDFNRTDPFGATGNAATTAKQGVNGLLVSTALIGQASLASQADGPPDNKVEMSCDGRTFNGANSLAAKMLSSPPLSHQQVSTTDSMLGSLANTAAPGLNTTYQSMINAAFSAPVAGDAQNKFTSIFGQAVQAYEATLVSDQTPFDSFLGGNQAALTANQRSGMSVFQGKGQCTVCHSGAEMTDASWTRFNASGGLNSDGGDQGFHNLGVRPTAEDLGRASTGPKGVSFSVSGSSFDRGAFKTAGLRNVGLTAPYFHTGSKSTLADVVAFYARGGDFANPEKARSLRPVSLSATEQAQVVDFLQNGLTDCRVARERAPFDHPSLAPPNGAALPPIGAAGTGSCP
jgi:cytochrome c peroxidase